MGKVTIYDIADRLNVSTASVTRALNGLPKVSDERRKLIIDTAEEMGYTANRLAVSLSRKTVKIAVVLYASIEDFYSRICLGIEDAYSSLIDFNIKKDMYMLNTGKQRDEDLIQIIKEIGQKDYNGLLFHSIHDSPEISSAVERLIEKGMTICTINTDISIGKKHYCVMNNSVIAGRTAAELLDWSVPNRKVCLFMGTKETKSLKEINESFLSECIRRKLLVVGKYYDDDSPDQAIDNLDEMLLKHPDVGGIYISSAISYAICNHLVEQGRADQLRIITSDLLPDIVKHVKGGVIQATIYQNPFLQGSLGFLNLYKIVAEKASVEKMILVNPVILTKSNIDLYI